MLVFWPATIYIFRNDGERIFTEFMKYSAGQVAQCLVTADVNNDGYPDIITAHYDAMGVSVRMDNGDGTFSTKVKNMLMDIHRIL